jgi:predicted TIM-barrel fold metal-dependent hydrolase
MTGPRPLLTVCAMASLAALASACTFTQAPNSADLATYIDTLRAIDSHAHPMAFVAQGSPADTDYDALPLDGIPAFDFPLALRATNPAYREAQLALYGVASGDSGSAASDALVRTRSDLSQKKGADYPAWVLDQLHIDVMLANRVAMGTGLTPPRFRWVAFVDPLMLPLDIRAEAERTPDTRPLYPLEARLLRRYLADLGLTKVPLTLAAYQRDVLTATLERQHQEGAVAIKFEAAYLRSLDFAPADSVAAAAIYARYAAGGVPTHAEYTLLEDFLVRRIAREAGRLGMAVQIHSLAGFGGYYNAAGAAPHLLQSLVSDSTLRATRFIVVHGGWPLVGETLGLLLKPNVYTDISMMDQLAEPSAVAGTLRLWLSIYPEKVLFGTDAFDGGPEQGWEQVAWVATRNARRALTEALSGMVRDGEISPERARDLARMVMRENAERAYRLGGS